MPDVATTTTLDLHGVLERAELPDFDLPAPRTSADRRYACAIAMVELGHAAPTAIGVAKLSPSTKEGTEERWT
jgi:hypothetical protein